jgi:hypothetical protein
MKAKRETRKEVRVSRLHRALFVMALLLSGKPALS